MNGVIGFMCQSGGQFAEVLLTDGQCTAQQGLVFIHGFQAQDVFRSEKMVRIEKGHDTEALLQIITGQNKKPGLPCG